jgi:hypothetical protein
LSIAIGIGLNGWGRGGIGRVAGNAMPIRPDIDSKIRPWHPWTTATYQVPVGTIRACLVPGFWIKCHPPRTQRQGVPISCALPLLLDMPMIVSWAQTSLAPLDRPSASAVPNAARTTPPAAPDSPYELTVPEISIAPTLASWYCDPEVLFLMFRLVARPLHKKIFRRATPVNAHGWAWLCRVMWHPSP